MMFPSFLTHVGIAVLAAALTSGPTHTWIADIKAQRSTLMGKEVRLEGEVVDVRSTSPTVRRGYYRLTDASDPVGVLVRTDEVPIDGGSFRLRARVADDQIVNGTLLLDELERDQTNARPLFPVIAVLGSGLALALLVVLFRRALTEERRYAVAPPLWLLPSAGPYGKALAAGGPVQPPLQYDPELEEVDRYQKERLKRRKRGLLQAMVGSLALTGSSTVWVLNTKPSEGQVPAFIFIDSTDPFVPGSPQILAVDTANAGPEATIGGDSALRATPVTLPDTARDRRNSTALALAPARIRPADAPQSTRRPDSAPVNPDTVRRDVVIPPPAPSPSPAPAPAPPPPDAVTPARDPELDRARAVTRVEEAAGRLVAAINARRSAEVALMMPESMAGDLGRRTRFLKLIKDFAPRATLVTVGPAELAGDRGEATISIALSWRGDFGVDHRNTGRFAGIARRGADGWRFEGAKILNALP